VCFLHEDHTSRRTLNLSVAYFSGFGSTCASLIYEGRIVRPRSERPESRRLRNGSQPAMRIRYCARPRSGQCCDNSAEFVFGEGAKGFDVHDQHRVVRSHHGEEVPDDETCRGCSAFIICSGVKFRPFLPLG
jgi:hypothetical protein